MAQQKKRDQAKEKGPEKKKAKVVDSPSSPKKGKSPKKKLLIAPASTSSPVAATPKVNRSQLKNLSPEEKLEFLKVRKIKPHHGVDLTVAAQLGIDDDVAYLIDGVGWKHFFNIAEPVYRDLTLEFLSTVKVYEKTGTTYMSFTLDGVARKLTLAKLAEIFQLPYGGLREPDGETSPHVFWHMLSVDKDDPLGLTVAAELALDPDAPTKNMYNASRSKVSNIFHPAIRYVQRYLTCTIFGRGDGQGNFEKTDALAIACMLTTTPLDGAYFLAHRFETQANIVADKIVVGGLITFLAKSYGIDLDEVTPEHEICYMDIPYLTHIKLIERVGDKVNGPIYYRFQDHPLCPLPFDPPLPAIENKDSWRPPHLLAKLTTRGVPPSEGCAVPSTITAPTTSTTDQTAHPSPSSAEALKSQGTPTGSPSQVYNWKLKSKSKLRTPISYLQQHASTSTSASLAKRLKLMEDIQEDHMRAQATIEHKLDKLLKINGKILEKQAAHEKENNKFKREVMKILQNMKEDLAQVWEQDDKDQDKVKGKGVTQDKG